MDIQEDEGRLSSSRLLRRRPILPPTRDNSFVSSNQDSCHTGKHPPATGNAIQKRHKTYITPRHFSSTYEGIFHKKKAFSERGFSSFPSQNSHTGGSHFHAQQHTFLTKIITETNYEYEEEEEEQKSGPGNSKRSSKEAIVLPYANGKKIILPAKSKIPRATIVDQPTKVSSSPTKKGKSVEFVNDGVKLANTDSKIPRLILPGHRDPYMQLPDPEVRSDAGESHNNHDEPNEHKKDVNKCCGKCKVYKNLLTQSEATLRYLTQILVSKDKELERLGNVTDGKIPFDVYSFLNASTTIPALNPLMKDENGETNRNYISSESTCVPGAATLLKFDLDEFIRKYFQNLLFTKDFQDSPFSPLQLFHVAISARDCMVQQVMQKLKFAESILKQKYDILVSMKSLSQPIDDSLFFSVLDSYRRLIRYIHYYFKQSTKQVESFEQTYISQQYDTGADEAKKPMIYSYKDIVTINGERYSAVIIPFQKITTQDDARN